MQLLAYQECGPEFADVVWQYGQVKVRAAVMGWGARGPLMLGLVDCPFAHLHTSPSLGQTACTTTLPPFQPQEELRKVEHALHHFSQLEMELTS